MFDECIKEISIGLHMKSNETRPNSFPVTGNSFKSKSSNSTSVQPMEKLSKNTSHFTMIFK